MKVTVSTEKDQTKYPCLYKFDSGYIVLINEDRSGVVVREGSGFGVGDSRKKWSLMGSSPLTGTITLEND